MTDVNGFHSFVVGQSVRRTMGFGSKDDLALEFEVVRQLPADGCDFFYRIKNADEGFERVVGQDQLIAAQDASVLTESPS